MEGNERWSAEELREFNEVADGLGAYSAGFYEKDPSTITETERGILKVAKAYLKLYSSVFKD